MDHLELPRDLERLRDQSARLLADVQGLPGFSGRLRSLPSVPTIATGWMWDEVQRTRDRGTDARPGDVTPAEVAELAGYADAVVAFSRDYVFAVGWGPRAVHDALRRRAPIVLPAALPLPPLVSDVPLRLAIDPGDPISPELAEDVRRWFVGLAPHPEYERLRRERLTNVEEAKARVAQGFEAGALEAVEAHGRRMRRGPSAPLPRLTAASAAGALERVRLRLLGAAAGDKERKAYTRVRRPLEAAVSARADLVPLSLVDDGATARERKRLEKAGKAMSVGPRDLRPRAQRSQEL